MMKHKFNILACPVCSGELQLIERKHGKFVLYCNKCDAYYTTKKDDIIFMIPSKKHIREEVREIIRKTELVYDRYSSLHDKSYENPMMQYMRLIERSVITRYSRCGTVLDLGCGTGTYTEFFVKRGCNVIAADISAEMLLTTKKRLGSLSENVLFVQADVGWLPFKPNSFDTVVAIFGVLNHTLRYRVALQRLYRSLKPGGTLIFTVLNAYRLKWFLHEILHYRRIKWILKQIRYHDGYLKFPISGRVRRVYTHSFSYFELRKLLRESGFKKIRIGSIFFLLRPMFVKSKRSYLTKLERKLSRLEDKLRWIFPFSALGYYLIVVVQK